MCLQPRESVNWVEGEMGKHFAYRTENGQGFCGVVNWSRV